MQDDPHGVVTGYTAAADMLIELYEAIPVERHFAPVLDLLPRDGTVLDVGASTGRDAAWLTRRGCRVTAVEPVAAFCAAGQERHRDLTIDWRDDRLPRLDSLTGDPSFGSILMCGVWHHLDVAARATAMPRLTQLLAPGGRMILSLRHGPTPDGRAGFPVPANDTVALALRSGLRLERRSEASSIQADNIAAGVRWTWLALRAPH